MSKARKHDAGQAPSAAQRDERGGVGAVEEQQLGSTAGERKRVPKLPHERDQTTGDQSTAADTGEGNEQLMRQAHDDLQAGKQDTDRGPVMDEAYHRLRKEK